MSAKRRNFKVVNKNYLLPDQASALLFIDIQKFIKVIIQGTEFKLV